MADILVADDHQQILEAIGNILKSHPGIGAVDMFSDGFSACAKLSVRHYDLYIVDLRLPRIDGFLLIKRIREAHPRAKIIINTMCDELWDTQRILDTGAEGVVLKTSSVSHLKEAVDSVLAGKEYRCPKFRSMVKQQDSGTQLDLSKRETDVLNAIAEGLTTDDISRRYGLSENTVESIRKRLLLKMDARNMAHLVAMAHKAGLITNYRTDAPPD